MDRTHRKAIHFQGLTMAAARRKLEVVLTMHKVGKADRLRIEIRSGRKIIDCENVGPNESVDEAAKRLNRKCDTLLRP